MGKSLMACFLTHGVVCIRPKLKLDGSTADQSATIS